MDLITSIVELVIDDVRPAVFVPRGARLQVAVQRVSAACKLFSSATDAVLHAKTDVVSAGSLKSLKVMARGIDLGFAHTFFLRELERAYGHITIGRVEYDVDEEGELEAPGGEANFLEELVERFYDGEDATFCKAVETQYKRFLVVKAVELRAFAKKAGGGAVSSDKWLERCQPTQILDVMWHAHMLYPKHYAASCQLLVGGIIDHDPSYINPKTIEGSGLGQKIEDLFEVESRWQAWDDDDNSWKLVSDELQDFYQLIDEEMNDPGCG